MTLENNNQPTNNTPIHFFGVDDATRARLKREYEHGARMQLIQDLASDEYQRMMRQQWRSFWANEIKEMNMYGDNDVA